MKNFIAFLKNNWAIVITFLALLLYLTTAIGPNNPYQQTSHVVYQTSYLFILLLLIQLLVWSKSKIKFSLNKILFFLSLFIINFYFLYDFYLSSRMQFWFGNVEAIGWSLNALAVLSGMVLIIGSLYWIGCFVFLLTKFYQKFSKKR